MGLIFSEPSYAAPPEILLPLKGHFGKLQLISKLPYLDLVHSNHFQAFNHYCAMLNYEGGSNSVLFTFTSPTYFKYHNLINNYTSLPYPDFFMHFPELTKSIYSGGYIQCIHNNALLINNIPYAFSKDLFINPIPLTVEQVGFLVEQVNPSAKSISVFPLNSGDLIYEGKYCLKTLKN